MLNDANWGDYPAATDPILIPTLMTAMTHKAPDTHVSVQVLQYSRHLTSAMGSAPILGD